ncbi:uncharacterized protein LOC108740653 [Agrilus planipennis]|uniref:Uncharacterized protein LOC108740653 n=1 Tax=Agrilus planipennis TaxID=224129 RepID=A0A1W4X381_AGRPL|nr:uncharacterized protein LOC108740653 [Agrilus planipennis]
MNSLLTLLLFYFFCFCSVSAIQVSSKLDFGQKGTYNGEPSFGQRRVKTPSVPLIVNQQDNEGDKTIKPLTVVCLSTECNRKGKTTVVRNVPKPDVVVQVITDSGNKNTSEKSYVEVPDVPVILGTKGVPYNSNPRNNENTYSRHLTDQRPPVTEKVYIPLFGSSVLEAPTTRRYRSTSFEDLFPYYKTPSYEQTPRHIGQTYVHTGMIRNNGFQRVNNRHEEGNLPVVTETLICTYQDVNHENPYPINYNNWNNFIRKPMIHNSPRYRPPKPITWNVFESSNTLNYQQRSSDLSKRLGIDNKLLPLD